MRPEDLTDEQKDKIHDRLTGTMKFDWNVVSDVLGVEDTEELFYDETEVMAVCGLEYCEVCEWIFSADDCGDHPEFEFVCPSCEIREAD